MKTSLSRSREIFFGLIASVISLALCLLAVEFALRYAWFNPSLRYVLLPGWEIIFRPSPTGTPGVLEDAHVKVNRLGLRGDLPGWTASKNLLVIGGSTVQDIVLNDRDTWVGVLQQQIKGSWVGNAGKAGTNSLHHVMQVAELLSRRPRIDRVIVLLGLNDMLFDAMIQMPESFKNGPPPGWNEAQAFMYQPPADFSEQLATYQFGLRVFAQAEIATRVPIIEFGKLEESYKKRRREVVPGDFISTVPDMTERLARFRANLLQMVASAEENRTPISFVTQPAIWKEEMSAAEEALLYAGGVAHTDVWPTQRDIKWFTPIAMLTMLEAYNDVTRSVCRERNLACVDLAKELPKSIDNYYDDFHFSKAGANAVGRIVSQKLRPVL